MAEELQGLLEKIKRDGVEKAQSEAATITDAAKEKAAALVAEAEQKAKAIVEQAKNDATQFESRARSSLAQASRDLVITVGQNVGTMLEKLLGERVRGELGGETLASVITSAVNAYISGGTAPTDLSVSLSDKDRKALETSLNESLKQALADGVTVESDSSVVAGFRVSMQGGRLTHDFTDGAVTDALAGLLRPSLAAIVRESGEARDA